MVIICHKVRQDVSQCERKNKEFAIPFLREIILESFSAETAQKYRILAFREHLKNRGLKPVQYFFPKSVFFVSLII